MHWKRPPGELVYARATDLSCIIKNVYNALHAVKGKEATLLTMSARNEEKDTLIASGNLLFFARRPIGSCNLVLFIHHWLMRGRKSVHNSRIGAKPFLHCET